MASSIKFVAGFAGGVFVFFIARYAVFDSSSSFKSGLVFPFFRSAASDSSTSFDSELVKGCNEFNKNCPMFVDANTRLDNASTIDKKIIYSYTLLNLPDDVLRKNQNEIKRIVSNTARSNSDSSELLRDGIELEYVYKNKDGNELFRFSVK